ncbi:box C/D snoRNA protein 1 [Genypterus blacodes]|uniref:box C/D snoRNA protein 1 n=1 Tax=Genypterus blacodes TaxID=154954 RepID=UPI003F758E70
MCSLTVPKMDIMPAGDSRVEDSSEEDEARAAKRKMSLSQCGQCGSEEAKYKCPACFKHSCSLLCVKNHKERSGCTGVRDKTAYVALSQFDEMALLNDYRLLEDTGRFADGANRDSLIRAPRVNFHARLLINNARKMNITLRLLPNTFTKSRENSTFFYKKEQQFLWHLKLVFPQSNAGFSRRRVADTQTLEEILSSYIHPTESDPVTRQKLKMYAQAPFDDVRVFMKAEGRKANSTRYYKLDMKKSLRDNLSYKVLIEYPVLHVVLRDYSQDYPQKGPGPVPAKPASASHTVATKPSAADQEKQELTQVSISTPKGSRPVGEAGICKGTPETSPEAEPPQKKRVKRDAAQEDLEEGEVTDGSDEEKEQEEELSGEDRHRVRAGEVTKEELEDNEEDDDGKRDSSAPHARKSSGQSA